MTYGTLGGAAVGGLTGTIYRMKKVREKRDKFMIEIGPLNEERDRLQRDRLGI